MWHATLLQQQRYPFQATSLEVGWDFTGARRGSGRGEEVRLAVAFGSACAIVAA